MFRCRVILFRCRDTYWRGKYMVCPTKYTQGIFAYIYIKRYEIKALEEQLIYTSLPRVACRKSISCSTRCLLFHTAFRNRTNSFWGDVVLDSFRNTSRDKDSILDQIYLKQICSEFYYKEFLIFITLYENAC